MLYEDRIVAFIDILAFKESIKNSIDEEGKENLVETDRVFSALEAIRTTLVEQGQALKSTNKFSDITTLTLPDFNLTQFSDSVFISFPCHIPSAVYFTVVDLLLVSMALIEKKFLTRGGIVLGKAIHTDKIIFGPAIIEAYNLEKSAFYPRIVVDEKVIIAGSEAHHEHHETEQEKKYILEFLKIDSDGLYYVDYFHSAIPLCHGVDKFSAIVSYLNGLRNIITTGLAHSDINVKIKYGWMKDKYNVALAQIGGYPNVDPIL